jgi:hypothetical protein
MYLLLGERCVMENEENNVRNRVPTASWNFRTSWKCTGISKVVKCPGIVLDFSFCPGKVLESMYILPRLLPCDYCRHNYVMVICAQQFSTVAKCVLKNAEFVLEMSWNFIFHML